MIAGDRFTVYYSADGNTLCAGCVDFWSDAVSLRDATFSANPSIRACWIMRDNPTLGLRPDKRGYTLRRRRNTATEQQPCLHS